MLSVRPFETKDTAALTALLLEMAASYGAAIGEGRDIEAEVVAAAGRFGILMAFTDDGTPAGFVTVATLFPVGGVLPFSYVQQVYVAALARRLGVARALMAAVARLAKEQGHTAVEWATGVENTAARALYDGLGATGMAKVSYVLHGEALDRLADAG